MCLRRRAGQREANKPHVGPEARKTNTAATDEDVIDAEFTTHE
jgi:hypothetical protein